MKIESLWRYPVKSFGGERLQRTRINNEGVIGDRRFAVHDGKAIRGAKKFKKLMNFTAKYESEPEENHSPNVLLDIDGIQSHTLDAEVNNHLSRALGKSVRLDSLRPAEELNYYRKQSDSQSLDEIRKLLGLNDDEQFPDFSQFPASLFDFATLPGTFFDAYPLLILTSSSLATLQAAAPHCQVDVRRFRPNIVLDTTQDGYIEEQWEGAILRIGEVQIQLTLACPRCVMTTIAFADLPQEPKIMRALVEENHHKLGIYGRVLRSGVITVGDAAAIN